MNRKIKKIVALALVISAFNAIMPATSLNLITTKAYASTGDLTSIKLKTLDGSTIKTYTENDYKSKNQVDDNEMDEGETYYAKTSSQKIKISTSGVSSNYVRIFKGKNGSTKGVKTTSTIDLSSASTTTLIIRTYSEDPGSISYSDNSFVSEYTIKIKYSTDIDENGDVYLKTLSLSSGSLSFSKNISTYTVNVPESLSEINVTARPDCDADEYDDYEVTIDGKIVDRDDNFKRTVLLNDGSNEIKVTVEDNDANVRAYMLNIIKGNVTNNSTSGNSSDGSTKNQQTNQWIQVNGKWQYNDAAGNPVKNGWITNYYLQADGNMATGWLNYGDKWYYLGDDGAKKAGWQLIQGNWYYLDSEGRMQTGWIKDMDGKYYYLYTNGTMARNTTIGGYKLASTGAWVK